MAYTINNELYHHGVLGMKWGVRRYQSYEENPKLSDRKVKKLRKMDGENLYKKLNKQAKKARADYNGSYWSRWARQLAVGKESEKVLNNYKENMKNYENSKEYKDWEKKIDDFVKNTEYDDDYDEKFNALINERPEKNFTDLQSAMVIGSNGRHYVNDFVNKGGADLSMAILKDLGYTKEDAALFIKKMAKYDRTLG